MNSLKSFTDNEVVNIHTIIGGECSCLCEHKDDAAAGIVCYAKQIGKALLSNIHLIVA